MGEMLQPRRFGGEARPAAEFVAEVAALTARDGSAGWRCAMANAAAYTAGALPDHAGAQVWGGDTGARVAMGLSPGGRLERGPLGGQWRDVAGADLADWFLLVAGDDLVLAPRAEVTVTVPSAPAGLSGAGLAELRISDLSAADARVFPGRDDGAAVIGGAAATAAV